MTKPWIWSKVEYADGTGWKLLDGQGRNRASVWPNGTWHSFDTDGIGGHNDVCANVKDAMDQALAAVVKQGWTAFKIKYEKVSVHP